MELYGVAAIILLSGFSYYLGLRTANWYHNKSEQERTYALERQYLRLRAGADYNDPVGPYVSRCNPIHSQPGFSRAQLEEFEARRRNNGSAVMMLNRQPHTTTKEKENEQ